MSKVSRRGGDDVGQRWPRLLAVWTSHCIGLYPGVKGSEKKAVPIDSGAHSVPAVLSAGRQYNVEGAQSEPRLAGSGARDPVEWNMER